MLPADHADDAGREEQHRPGDAEARLRLTDAFERQGEQQERRAKAQVPEQSFDCIAHLDSFAISSSRASAKNTDC